jgi:hypothetical protein
MITSGVALAQVWAGGADGQRMNRTVFAHRRADGNSLSWPIQCPHALHRALARLLIGALVGGLAVGLAGCGASSTMVIPGTTSSGSSTDASSGAGGASDPSVAGSSSQAGTTSATTTSPGAGASASARTTSAGHTTGVKITTSQRPTTASSNQADAITQLIQEGGATSLVLRISKGKISPAARTAHESVGQTLRLIVVSDVSGIVRCPTLGVSVKIIAGRPAPADLIAVDPGSYPVTFTPSGGAAIRLVAFAAA